MSILIHSTNNYKSAEQLSEKLKMEIIESNKRGRKLCFEGNMYTKQKTTTNFVHWKCTKRTDACTARLKTSLDLLDPEVVGVHNHQPSQVDINISKARIEMKNNARNNDDNPALIFSNALEQLHDLTRANLPLAPVCKRTIRNQRAAEFPPVPATLQELVINRDGEWGMTRELNPSSFLFYDNGPETNSRIIAFGKDGHMPLLCASRRWLMDGCFAMAPPGFLQLYVVHAPLGEVTVPVIYVFLERKTQETYEELLNAIIEHCEQLDLHPDPDSILTDFEVAVIQAIQGALGDAVDTDGCFYHLTQATWRKIQELGLTVRYRTDPEFQHFCGMLDGLAFLPVDDVIEGFDHLRLIAPADVEDLLTYFDSTYVNGIYRARARGNGNNIRVRHIRPRFPPAKWNVNERTLNNEPRTNNFCEGWNSRFSTMVGYNHPSIWKAIKSIQGEANVVSTKILQAGIGNPPRKNTKRVYIRQQERLRQLCLNYQNGNVDLAGFLAGVGHNIHLGKL